MWYVYIVQCIDQTYYTGITNNLARRVKTHNSGKGARYTAQRKPVKLVWYEGPVSQSYARKKEIEVKDWRREKKLALIKNFVIPNGKINVL
jgi:putative endonuclease